MQLQHFLLWNKANIKHSYKSQLYRMELRLSFKSLGSQTTIFKARQQIELSKASYHLLLILTSKFFFINLVFK